MGKIPRQLPVPGLNHAQVLTGKMGIGKRPGEFDIRTICFSAQSICRVQWYLIMYKTHGENSL